MSFVMCNLLPFEELHHGTPKSARIFCPLRTPDKAMADRTKTTDDLEPGKAQRHSTDNSVNEEQAIILITRLLRRKLKQRET
jgi:hypothetical protein